MFSSLLITMPKSYSKFCFSHENFNLTFFIANRFEKYISGKYLGEVVRVVLKSLADKGLLFSKASKELFPAPWKFGTDNVSHIEE
jgi:hexokinase